MPSSTRATLALGNLGVSLTLQIYGYDRRAERIGLQAADALGVEARRMLKTLMAEDDGKPACVIIPADREIAMKSSPSHSMAIPQG
jgi:Cys-tRNA(Pro)/Cys-tRNA(Cys) deacylase